MSKPVPLLPAKLWVGSYEFRVKLLNNLDSLLENEDGQMHADQDKGFIIAVSDSLDSRRRLEIVWHEITHAINWAQDIEDGVDEEQLATKHGWAWSQFLLDNPRFERWLSYTLVRIRKEQKAGD